MLTVKQQGAERTMCLGVGGTTCLKRRSESRGLSHSLRAGFVSPSHLSGIAWSGFCLVLCWFCFCCLCLFVSLAIPASFNEMPNFGSLFKTATIVMMRAATEQKPLMLKGSRPSGGVRGLRMQIGHIFANGIRKI